MWLTLHALDGLIPAHAGKTSHAHPATHSQPAHPRSRGENGRTLTGYRRRYGSSPLTRGKRVSLPLTLEPLGLIPAHAGKTAPRPPLGRPRPAHPRSRGENISSRDSGMSSKGSSPLTRGKPHKPGEEDSLVGLIPAHAGKTDHMRRR